MEEIPNGLILGLKFLYENDNINITYVNNSKVTEIIDHIINKSLYYYDSDLLLRQVKGNTLQELYNHIKEYPNG